MKLEGNRNGTVMGAGWKRDGNRNGSRNWWGVGGMHEEREINLGNMAIRTIFEGENLHVSLAFLAFFVLYGQVY